MKSRKWLEEEEDPTGRAKRWGRYRRGAPPPRAAYGPTVMPVPVPMFSPFGFGMPFGFGYGMPFGFFGGGGFIFSCSCWRLS